MTGVEIGIDDLSAAEKTWRMFRAFGDIAFAYTYSQVLIEIQVKTNQFNAEISYLYIYLKLFYFFNSYLGIFLKLLYPQIIYNFVSMPNYTYCGTFWHIVCMRHTRYPFVKSF